MSSKRSGHVYVASAKGVGVKIGRSNNPVRRMVEINMECKQRDMWSLAFFTHHIDDAHAIERQAQRILALHAEHVGYEVFEDVKISAAVLAVAIAIRQSRGDELPLAGVFRSKEAAIRRNERERARAAAAGLRCVEVHGRVLVLDAFDNIRRRTDKDRAA